MGIWMDQANKIEQVRLKCWQTPLRIDPIRFRVTLIF